MDSIQQQKAEASHQDLQGAAALAQLRDMVRDIPDCFFCTCEGPGHPVESRPMNVREVDDEGNLWFLSSSDSLKNRDIAHDRHVDLFFQEGKRACFLHVAGRATISRDRARMEALWTPVLRNWFTGGLDDPRLTVIKVTPDSAYYWDQKHGRFTAGVKMLIGAATGRTLDDGVQGNLKPH